MPMFNRCCHARALAAAALWLTQVACTTQTVTISRWLPSEIAMPEVSTLAVAPFAGPFGAEVDALLSEEINATEQLRLIDAEAVATEWAAMVLDQNDNDARGPHDGLLALGRILGADAVLSGAVHAVDVQVRADTILDNSSHGATCHLRRQVTARLQGELLILRTSDGRALYFAPVEHTLERHDDLDLAMDVGGLHACDDPAALARDALSPVDEAAWRQAAVADFAVRYAHKLMPHWEGQEVELYVDDNILESKRAVAALLMGDWAGAVAIYSRGVEAAQSWITPRQTRARAHYNLGTTLAYGGMVARGLEHLHRAQAIAPCDRFAEQIARAQSYGERPRATAPRHHLIDVAPVD